ncbi:MAG: prephenate dehydratase [Candidatus Zixiibacteriota bacterium]
MPRKRFAFQGERGAFSEVAGRQLAGPRALAVPCAVFDDVFRAVERGTVDIGVVPIENSLIGSINVNYDLLLAHPLHIVGETQLRIVHCLIAKPGVTLQRIRAVHSHPAALDQCRGFFNKNRRLRPVAQHDTAGAVRMLTETDDESIAAIASSYAADLYGLRVLRKSIEDEKQNFTRFVALGKAPIYPRKDAKTSVVFSLQNKAGALFRALSVFALRDISMSRIESRPARGRAWSYNFFVDFEGSPNDEAVQNALSNLEEIATFVRVLGCYRKMM